MSRRKKPASKPSAFVVQTQDDARKVFESWDTVPKEGLMELIQYLIQDYANLPSNRIPGNEQRRLTRILEGVYGFMAMTGSSDPFSDPHVIKDTRGIFHLTTIGQAGEIPMEFQIKHMLEEHYIELGLADGGQTARQMTRALKQHIKNHPLVKEYRGHDKAQ